MAHQPCPVSHIEQRKTEQEAEAVGNHIGKVEAVPDVVQLTQNETEHKEQQQKHGANLIAQLHIPGCQVQKAQQNAAHTGVQIRQTLLEGRFYAAAHIARHLAHGFQQTLPGILTRDIHTETLGELIDAGLGCLQSGIGRQFQNRRHADCEYGKERNPAQILKEAFNTLPAADLIDKKQQKNKDAGEESDIVVGKHREEQRHSIQNKVLIPQQCNSAQCHQRQERKGIQPHNIPLVTQRPRAQTVKRAEHRNGKILFIEHFLQEDGEKQSRKSQLHRHQQREVFQKPVLRYDHTQQIQRRCQIIGNQPQVIHAKTHTPAVEQAFAAAQRFPEGNKEGIILVVHIGIQHGIIAERLITADEHDKQHSRARECKCQHQRIPCEIILTGQVHGGSP